MLFRLLFFVLATLFGTCVRAQVLSPGLSPGERGVYDIQATVTFADGYRPGGNVAILHPTDSSLLGGDFFLDGEILLPGREEPELLLRFTSLEFADRYLVVRYDGQPTLDLGVLEMRPAELALDAITVRARKPVYTQRADGSVEVLVAGSVLAASSSTTEILSKSPDVQIDEDGALSVVGRGAALLYLDGQPITAEQLTLVVPANIQKITVIRNPSARYEASGGAVIEITTRRGREDGYRGQFIQNLGHSAFGGEQGFSSLTASLNHGRLSANAGYSLLYGRDRHVKHTTRDRTDPAVFLSSDLRTDWQPRLAPHANHNLGLQYTAPGGAYLSLAYAATAEHTRGNTFNTNRLEDAEGVLDYTSDIARNETNRVRSLSLNFGQDLDSLGSRLFVGGQYVRYANGGNNPIREDGRTPGGPTLRWLRNLIDVNINVVSAQVDYTKVFTSSIRLESGLRHAEVDNRSDLDFLLSADNVTFTESEALSSLYRYQEGVSAAYANLNGRLGERLSYGLGLRAELTDYRLQLSETDDDELTNR
ncbi:MAG: outer membrane beta-barrel protein, partial [Bacteroidota bacterium]